MPEPTHRKFNVELGPLFTAGIALAAYGLFRRRVGVVLAGLIAIWLDQRSEFGRSLKEGVRAKYMTRMAEEDASGDVPE